MVSDASELEKLSSDELDALFRAADPGEIPRGEGDGTILIEPGTKLTGPAAQLVHLLGWQGKVFDPDSGELRNELLPWGAKLVIAKVYKAPSWLDQREAIILDYSETSLVARWIRDEIRLVGPGIYLGVVYWEHDKFLHFALTFKH